MMEQEWSVEEWIWENLSPVETVSASLLYERMESQSSFKLPMIYEPLNVQEKGHWHDATICAIFAAAMGGAREVLDIGPGDGWPILRTAHFFQRSVGVDLSPKRVAVQRENAQRLGIENVEFHVMDSMNLHFPSASFDGVIAASSVEQSKDPRRTLGEVARVLRKGGRLAIFFEDLEIYFPKDRGDERVWVHLDGDTPILFYVCREKEPPREAVYALFLQPGMLEQDLSLKKDLMRFASDPGKSLEASSLSSHLLRRLKPAVRECQYYALAHLTSSQLEKDLLDLGFVNMVTVDPFLADVMDFFQLAKEKGFLPSFRDNFTKICEILGTMKVLEAETGCGALTVAEKGND